MASFNGPINEAFPTPEHADKSTVSYIQKGFKISARKLPISKSGPIDEMSEKLGIPVPEMIFGDNMVSIEHIATGWRLEFNAYDALDRVDKTDKNMLQVAYSKEWSSSREKTHEGIKEIVKPFDWSYTTDYRGTVTKGKAFEEHKDRPEPIPIELLKRPDPILFFEEVVLYESELDDNGISLYSCKLRVMPDRMLLLCRLFMRLDGVLVRIRDTRIYIDFNLGKVIRDYTEKEGAFDKVKQVRSTTTLFVIQILHKLSFL
ncbi:TIP41-like family-domain-containing protein [Halenospora varia]|nr:TIP41-like family-domain-containing protein [Halenospora varia]